MDKTFTEQESLQVIQRMIDNTKTTLRAQGHMYILWGIMTAVAAILNYYFLKNPAGFPPGIVWAILMPLTGIVHGILVYKLEKDSRMTTFADNTMKFLWIGFTLSIIVLIVVMFQVGPANAYPMFMILYGLGIFASGGILDLKPLMIGGIACFVCAIIASFVPFDQQLLVIATASLVGFFLPGLLIYKKK